MVAFPGLESLGGCRQIDLGPSQLGSQVVHVSGQEDSDGEEQTDKNSGRLGLAGGRRSDDTVLANDLDTLNVRAGRLVGVVDAHLGLALACHLVDVLAVFVDLVVSTAAHALEIDDGLLGVRQFDAVVHRLEHVQSFVSKDRAGVVQKDTKVDLSSLFRTVGTNVVRNVVVVVVVATVVVVVQLAVSVVHLHLLAGHVGRNVNVVVVVLSIGKIALAIVLAVHVRSLHLAEVGVEVGFHVDDVVTVVAVASAGGSS